ncbi:DsrE family protein [Crateriforma spongiae]|uniref:DsrE family protein n=1 Tax=Crateriforma spongiae TaxID=2724528 RepID=UPI001F31F7C3|nr:DsrE family protein [Crateriforma spongiae]
MRPMNFPTTAVRLALGLLVTALFCVDVAAQNGRGPGFGRGGGRGPGFGMGRGFRGGAGGGEQAAGPHAHDDRHDADHEVFQFLLSHHDKIRRTVTETDDGVITVTESDDPEIAAKIQEHVHWMKIRVDEIQPIRMRDPLFAELFRNADKIKMQHEDTEKGVRVIETSDDPAVASLIKAHADVVSGFVANGFAEAMRNHAVPADVKEPNSTQQPMSDSPVGTPLGTPLIPAGKPVFHLPDAAQQPRSDSKLLIDVTQSSPADQTHDALETIAKYVNLYHAGGKDQQSPEMAVVLHGGATFIALNDDAYASRFGTKGNPNALRLRQLHQAGVEFYVCGQSLLHGNARPDDLVVFAQTAVSALTSLVNLQSDGFVCIELK